MNYLKYTFTLNIATHESQRTIKCKQGDTKRILAIKLANGDEPYHIEGGTFAVLKVQKPNGVVLFNHVKISGDTLYYPFTVGTANTAGVEECEIKLYDDSGVVTSARFRISVDAVLDEGAVESSPEFTALTQLIEEVQNIFGESPSPVLYGKQQSLTDTEKECARDNIDAASNGDVYAEAQARIVADNVLQRNIGVLNSALEQETTARIEEFGSIMQDIGNETYERTTEDGILNEKIRSSGYWDYSTEYETSGAGSVEEWARMPTMRGGMPIGLGKVRDGIVTHYLQKANAGAYGWLEIVSLYDDGERTHRVLCNGLLVGEWYSNDGGSTFRNLLDPTADTDAVSRKWVIDQIAAAPSGGGGKVRIDYSNGVFTVDGEAVNFKQIHDYLLVDKRFVFIVSGDRSYLPVAVDDVSTQKSVRFSSTLLNDGVAKTGSFFITSNDGVEITNVQYVAINSENVSNKVSVIDDANKYSVTLYPNAKAAWNLVQGKINEFGMMTVYPENRLDPDGIVSGSIWSDGNLHPSNAWTAPYIEVQQGDVVRLYRKSILEVKSFATVCEYDAEYNYLGVYATSVNTYQVQSPNARYVRGSMDYTDRMVTINLVPTAGSDYYEPYLTPKFEMWGRRVAQITEDNISRDDLYPSNKAMSQFVGTVASNLRLAIPDDQHIIDVVAAVYPTAEGVSF